MIKVIAIVITVLGIMSHAPQAVATDAPFGLRWGATAKSLKESNVDLSFVQEKHGAKAYLVESLDEGASIAGAYFLNFFGKHGLQAIQMVSMDIENDPFGREGIRLYEQYKTLLTAKYGAPLEETEISGLAFYVKPSEFNECLSRNDCGIYFSYWELPNSEASVGLRIRGVSSGTGYLTLLYEGPKHDTAKEEAFIDAISADKDVL